jgi:hypothetical protein
MTLFPIVTKAKRLACGGLLSLDLRGEFLSRRHRLLSRRVIFDLSDKSPIRAFLKCAHWVYSGTPISLTFWRRATGSPNLAIVGPEFGIAHNFWFPMLIGASDAAFDETAFR